jgi:hypothetical protein
MSRAETNSTVTANIDTPAIARGTSSHRIHAHATREDRVIILAGLQEDGRRWKGLLLFQVVLAESSIVDRDRDRDS